MMLHHTSGGQAMINDHQDLVDRVQVCGLCITPIPLDLLWHMFISCSPGDLHVKRPSLNPDELNAICP